jgi:hypothetical protein
MHVTHTGEGGSAAAAQSASADMEFAVSDF